MKIGPYRFDRVELAGGLGDLGTLVPLSIALVAVAGLGFTPVFLMTGLFYIAAALFFRLPIPVQPLKLVAAVAIASPGEITVPVIAASGLIFGAIMLILAVSGLIGLLARVFTKPIVRGIQLGLGFVFMRKGIQLIQTPELFGRTPESTFELLGTPANLWLGLGAALLTLLLFSSRRFPAALVVVGVGALVGILWGPVRGLDWSFGPTELALYRPGFQDSMTALWLLVIPQLPLTFGNAVIGSTDAARQLFGSGPETARVSNRSFALSMGFANLASGAVAGMPMCHGAGGLAGHYRFGARTGGATILLGSALVVLALGFGEVGLALLSAIPNAVLGVLLFFAGLELALLVRDVNERGDLFVVLLIAAVAIATGNLGLAFACGLAALWTMRWGKVTI